jgi:hypothetical protein
MPTQKWQLDTKQAIKAETEKTLARLGAEEMGD